MEVFDFRLCTTRFTTIPVVTTTAVEDAKPEVCEGAFSVYLSLGAINGGRLKCQFASAFE